jgi:superfamily I DNA/RNA helicase
MTLQFIEGGAGTGKTTALIDRVGQFIATSPLREHQRVLALTKMHGSRRSVRKRLALVPGLNGRFDAMTIDSFAWRIARRWRSLARVVSGPTPATFDQICEQAGRLLDEPCVQKWIAASFPVVLIDELQDSKGGQLRVLKGLCERCLCIAAGDPFQDLDGDAVCGSVEWARQQAVPTVLTTTHRTNMSGLLEAASALREGRAVSVARGFTLVGVDAYGLGAWEAAAKIAKWRSLGTIAVITPVTTVTSTFVRQLLERVNKEPPLGQEWKVGPFRVPWEMAHHEQVERACQELRLPDDDHALIGEDALALAGDGRIGMMRTWISRQRRLFGRREFTAAELRAAVGEVVQQARSHSRQEERRLAAMSIHQAKNREFDRVIVLWPYEVRGDDERKRRLAYNAVTRARHEAHVIVHGKARVTQWPVGPNGGRRANRTKRGRRAGSSEKLP